MYLQAIQQHCDLNDARVKWRASVMLRVNASENLDKVLVVLLKSMNSERVK